MSIRLALRITLMALIGSLLVVVLAAALQFREMGLALEAADEPETIAAVAEQATTLAMGLGILAVVVLVIGVAVARGLGSGVFARIATLDDAATAIGQGDHSRRVGLTGIDELARVAGALDRVLDERDRSEAEMRGHNREIRALLVALLRQWPKPAAVTGIDGEIIVSTLPSDAEVILRELAPRVRSAAKVLLSRGFASASELSTVINTGTGYVAHVQALALGGDRRVVGWLAMFTATEAPAVDEVVGAAIDSPS